MSTIGGSLSTLLDWAKREDPETQQPSTVIAELLTKSNPVIADLMFKPSNLPTAHRITLRTSYPDSTWRKLNEGVANTKSTTAQLDEAMGMLTQRSAVDKALADLNGGDAKFRLSESVAHIDSMAQEWETTFFYGASTSPEKFVGLHERFGDLSGPQNTDNIIDAQGTGSDNTSIWLVCYGEKSFYGIFPKGSNAGIKHTELKDGSADGCIDVLDSNSRPYRAYADLWEWNGGIAIPDWRYIVRICNIDVSNLRAESSNADLIKRMVEALPRVPNYNGVKPIFYMNRTAYTWFLIQAMNKTVPGLLVQDAVSQFGDPKSFKLSFFNIPIHMSDSILNTESRIV